MKREKEVLLDQLEESVPLREKRVLEVGCGWGRLSALIAERCGSLVGVDPNPDSIATAQQRLLERSLTNAVFAVGSAEHLDFADNSFDIIFFALSFHHVPIELMPRAIDEALRVVKKNGYIVFVEPAMDGSAFDAEKLFGTGDEDEDKEKVAAYRAMMEHPGLRLVQEIPNETVLHFDSVDDYIKSMLPTRNHDQIRPFLEERNFTFRAERRIVIFRPKGKGILFHSAQ